MGMELNSTRLQASFSDLHKVLLGKCNDPEQLIPLLMIAEGNGVQSGPAGGGSGTLPGLPDGWASLNNQSPF